MLKLSIKVAEYLCIIAVFLTLYYLGHCIGLSIITKNKGLFCLITGCLFITSFACYVGIWLGTWLNAIEQGEDDALIQSIGED